MKNNFLVLTLSVLALSCNKETNLSKNKDNNAHPNVMVSKAISGVDPSNRANPFDAVGVKCQSDAESLLSSMEGVTDVNDRKEILRQYLTTYFAGADYSDFVESVIANEDVTRDELNGILNTNGFSTAYTNYTLEMYDISSTPSGVSYQTIKNGFVAIEANIINDKSLSATESERLLSTASCERFMYTTCITEATAGTTNQLNMPDCSRRIWHPLQQTPLPQAPVGALLGALVAAGRNNK